MPASAVSCCYCPREATTEVIFRPTSGRLANQPLSVRVCDTHAAGPPQEVSREDDGSTGPRHAAPTGPMSLLSPRFWSRRKGTRSARRQEWPA
jgi:hypothetical protein